MFIFIVLMDLAPEQKIQRGQTAGLLEHFKFMYSRKNAQKSPNNYGPN